VNIPRKQTSSAAGLTVAYIALLLVATTAQAGHFCGFHMRNANGASQVGSSNAGCQTCLMASSTTTAMVFLAFFPSLRRSPRVRAPESRPRPFLESFTLSVRPPPAG
jgi:hypothetical protein